AGRRCGTGWPLRRRQHQARQVRRPHRGPGHGRRSAPARPWRDGRQHGRHQPRHGARLHPRSAVRLCRPRRPDLPRRGPNAEHHLRRRPGGLRRRGLGRRLESRSRMNHVTGAEGGVEKTWFGQPRGLTVLFMTNMWETFSYYGMRALLVYYMTRELLIGQEISSTIYSLYTGFAYFTPIIGGTIADRWLGKR